MRSMEMSWLRSILGILVATVGGCATTGDWWESEKVKGPVAGPIGQQSQVLHRCTSSNGILNIYSSNAGGLCVTAFKTQNGSMVSMQDLTKSIDDHLRTLPDFLTWPLESEGSSSFYRPSLRFYLVSIEPTIVLASTFDRKRRYLSGCGSPMQNQTCVPSKILGEGLEYEDAPKGSSEIFWFAPGLMKSWVRIDKGQLPYSIPIQKLDAQLKIENDRWVLERRN